MPQHMLDPKDSPDIIFCQGQITKKPEEPELYSFSQHTYGVN